MNQQRLMKVILAPVVTEKSNLVAEKRNQMVFKVLKDATKTEIKAAVELLFNVKVASVTTTTTKGKVKTLWSYIGSSQRCEKSLYQLGGWSRARLRSRSRCCR